MWGCHMPPEHYIFVFKETGRIIKINKLENIFTPHITKES